MIQVNSVEVKKFCSMRMARLKRDSERVAEPNPVRKNITAQLLWTDRNSWSQLFDCVGDAVAKHGSTRNQRGKVASRNPAQRASMPVLVQARSLAAQYVPVARASGNDGCVHPDRRGLARDIGNVKKSLEPLTCGRA